MHLTADISVSDEFENVNVNTFILDWRLVYRCKIKTNEVTKYKRYQNITLYQCMVGSFDKVKYQMSQNTKYIFLTSVSKRRK